MSHVHMKMMAWTLHVPDRMDNLHFSICISRMSTNVMHETNEELSDTRATQPNTGPGPCDGGTSTSTDGDRISPYAGTIGAASLMM